LLEPLFPVKDVREATAGRVPLSDEPRQGHVPIAAFSGFLDAQPTMAVELAFCPIEGLPEMLTDESWARMSGSSWNFGGDLPGYG